MPNLQTPMDLLGHLIDPRQEDEPLYEYKERLQQVGQHMLDRDFTPDDESKSWRKTREAELEGRVGERLRLIDGTGDSELIQQADNKLLTYDNINDRSGPLRWPELQPRGVRPRYGYAETKTGGVASPDSLRLQKSPTGIVAQPGYILIEDQLYYMPGTLKSISFHLPGNTTKTAVPPWQVRSSHAHKIEVIDEQSLRLVGEDDHWHTISKTSDGPTQTDYRPNHSGRDAHTHPIDTVAVNGPVFASTQPFTLTTTDPKGTTASASAAADGFLSTASNRPFAVPHLRARLVETDPDETGHVHKAKVSPHDFWSGDFILPADDHTHTVTDWSVEPSNNHRHTLPRPDVPEGRALVPRLVSYEGDQMFTQSDSPYCLNLSIEQGWTVAKLPGGFSEQLSLGFEVGGGVSVPQRQVEEDGTTIGVGPDLEVDRILTEVLQARFGFDIRLQVRAEDKFTGGVPNHKVTVKWSSNGKDHQLSTYTNKKGESELQIPTDKDDTSELTYTLEICGEDGFSETRVVELAVLEEPGGYGLNYGLEYGS